MDEKKEKNSEEMTFIVQERYCNNGRFIQYPDEWKEYLIKDSINLSFKGLRPKTMLPVYTPDFFDHDFAVTWLGHSSVYMSISGKHILIDPIFSKRCSPFRMIGPSRFSDPPADPESIPDLDLIVITHDHYDHLDKASIMDLDHRTARYVVPLGIERILIRWGIPNEKICSLAWWESCGIDNVKLICCPTRHFTGRYPVNIIKTLCCSWVIETAGRRIFISGDGSYGKHFSQLAIRYGSFDLAVMECGQYTPFWHSSHMYPEESATAAAQLNAKAVLPVHWGTFVLSTHPWDDPAERFVTKAQRFHLNVLTPHIGETIFPDDGEKKYEQWWRDFI